MEYSALILFTIATSITPGPNNLMIMTSGVNHGFSKSIPHLLGIDIGFPIMLIAVGLGMAELFKQIPQLMIWLKVLGTLYLCYLAFKIATAPVRQAAAQFSSSGATKSSKPLSFIQAALFQWLNPKAWIMAIGAVVTYAVTGEHYTAQVLTIALLFILFGAPCTVVWLGFGTALKHLLSKPEYLKLFNLSMGLLLFASLLPVIIELLEPWLP